MKINRISGLQIFLVLFFNILVGHQGYTQEGSDAGVTGGGAAVEQAQKDANEKTAQATESAVSGNGGSEGISQAADKGSDAVVAAAAANPGPAAGAGPAAGSPGLATQNGGGPPSKSSSTAKIVGTAVQVLCASCSAATSEDGKMSGRQAPRNSYEYSRSGEGGRSSNNTSSRVNSGSYGRGGGGGGGGGMGDLNLGQPIFGRGKPAK